jgi:hypothetical protein
VKKQLSGLLSAKSTLEQSGLSSKQPTYRCQQIGCSEAIGPISSTGANRWDEKAGLRRDAISSQGIDALKAHETRRPATKKPSTKTVRRTGRLQDQQLTVGLDLGDRSSFYCVLNGAGEVMVEERVTSSPEAMKKTFGKMPQSRIALETGTHSP